MDMGGSRGRGGPPRGRGSRGGRGGSGAPNHPRYPSGGIYHFSEMITLSFSL